MKRNAASNDDTMPSSSSKWERTNLRLPAAIGRNDSLKSASTGGSSSTSGALKKDAASAAAASQQHDYLYLPPTFDSSSIAIEADKHRSSRSTTRRLQLQHLTVALDRYLSSIPQLAHSTKQLLQSNKNNLIDGRRQSNNNLHKVITATNSGRVINVLQGEMAHCTPNQADVLVSDDATTCHILGLWSTTSSCCSSSANNKLLATIAHIDGPRYQDCIRDAVELHYQYHSSHHLSSLPKQQQQQEQQMQLSDDDSNEDMTIPVIELYIHLMGGYNDNEGISHEITEGILRALSNVSNDYVVAQEQKQQPRLQLILQTCAVSSSNDDGSRCPIGRGLALNVLSGQVYLAEVDEEDDVVLVESSPPSSSCLENDSTNVVAVTTSARGPDWILRQARLWASLLFKDDDNSDSNNHHNDNNHHKRRLQIIHHPTKDHLTISPFYFTSSHPFPHRMLLLSNNDEIFLRYTSSSPEVEKDNFVRHVRETFRFMNESSCLDVFEKKKKKKLNDETNDEDEMNGGRWDDDDYLPRRYRRVGLNGWAACCVT